MRNWKHYGILFLMAFIVLVFIACDNDKNNDPCNCNPKEHYLPCDCGKTDCNCVVIPRGYITDADFPSLNVPIYQTAGVENDAATTATTNIKNGYAGLASGYRNAISSAKNFKRIEIVADKGFSFNQTIGIIEYRGQLEGK